MGAAGSLLPWIGGLDLQTAVLSGGGTFAGSVLLVLTMLRFTTGAVD
jgi:hypothetical protein